MTWQFSHEPLQQCLSPQRAILIKRGEKRKFSPATHPTESFLNYNGRRKTVPILSETNETSWRILSHQNKAELLAKSSSEPAEPEYSCRRALIRHVPPPTACVADNGRHAVAADVPRLTADAAQDISERAALYH